MDIVKYEVLNPVSSNKKPYYDTKKKVFTFPVNSRYTYYVECALNGEDGGREYYLLLGITPFNDHCRRCSVDQYGRCKVNVRGEIKDFIISETAYRGNIDIKHVESTETYDVFVLE